ncbi:MAG: hypothetical protein U0401_15505 [Anaerolineae bacterium]
MFASSLEMWILLCVLVTLVLLLGFSLLAGHIIAIHRLNRW